MAALEAAATSIFLTNHPFSFSCLFPKLPHCIKLLHSSNSTPSLSYNFPTRNLCLQVCSTLQDTTVETKPEQTQKQNIRRKIYVFNLPWSFSVAEIKNLFAPCGTVVDVEVPLLSLFSPFDFLFIFFLIWVLFVMCYNADYKAQRWEKQKLCICDNGFAGRSSGCR